MPKPLKGERNSPDRSGVPLPGQRTNREVGSQFDAPDAADSRGVEHLHITGEDPARARELKSLVEADDVFNPIVSRAQQKAMYAAASGHSTLGIPKKVGKDFVAAGPASKHLPARKRKRNGY